MPLLRGIGDVENEHVLRILRDGDPRGGTAPFTPEEKRAQYRAAARRSLTAEMESVVDQQAGGVSIRTYRPKVLRAGGARVLYLHGGGFLSGDLETHDPVCRLIADGAGLEVTGVAYRLAPEEPYPAAVTDCFSVLEWMAREGGSRIAIVGDSAGGNLAAVLAIRARDAGIKLAAQVLIYPMLDAVMTSPSLVENAFVPPFTLVDCVQAWQWYLAPEVDRASADLSPLHARDLSGLAPALIVTAEFDILRDDGLRYRQKLRGSGVAVLHHHFDDMVHGFIQWSADIPRAVAGLNQVVDFLGTV